MIGEKRMNNQAREESQWWAGRQCGSARLGMDLFQPNFDPAVNDHHPLEIEKYGTLSSLVGRVAASNAAVGGTPRLSSERGETQPSSVDTLRAVSLAGAVCRKLQWGEMCVQKRRSRQAGL